MMATCMQLTEYCCVYMHSLTLPALFLFSHGTYDIVLKERMYVPVEWETENVHCKFQFVAFLVYTYIPYQSDQYKRYSSV